MGNKIWQYVAYVLMSLFIVSGSITYSNLINSLVELKGISYNYTGDIVNSNYMFKPEIWINTSYWEVCFSHYNDTRYADRGVLFKKMSRSRTLHVNLDYVDSLVTTYKLSTNGTWEEYKIQTQWNVPTWGKKWRPLKDGDCWRRQTILNKKVNKIQLVFNVTDDNIYKWSFNLSDSDNGVYIDPLLTKYSKEDIVEKSEIIELNDLTKCIYRTYKNPTNETYCFDVDGVSSKLSGASIKTTTEIKSSKYIYYIEEICNDIEVYSILNNSLYNVTLCNDFNITKSETFWNKSLDFCIDSEQALEFRRCYSKDYNLEKYLYEDHQPAFGYDLKEYTIIGSSGINQSIFNSSRIVSYWDFDIDATDSVGSNDGTISGTAGKVTSPCQIGNCTQFNYTETINVGEIDVASSGDFTSVVDFTWSLWTYNVGEDGDTINIFINDRNGGVNFQYGLTSGTDVPHNKAKIYSGTDIYSTNVQTRNAWHYNVATFNNSNNEWKIYIDGVLNKTAILALSSTNWAGISFGYFTLLANRFSFNGNLDEILFDDEVYSADDVTILFNNGEGLNPVKQVYGVYNDSATFNTVTIIHDCTDNEINISETNGNFGALSNPGYHTFDSKVAGFFIRVTSDSCSWVDMITSNTSVFVNTSLKHFDINIPEFIIDSSDYVLVSNTTINLTLPLEMTFRGGDGLRKNLGGNSPVSMRIDINEVTKFDEVIRTISGASERGIWNIRPFQVNLTSASNNIEIYIKETGTGSVNITNIELDVDSNESTKTKLVMRNVSHINIQDSNTVYTNIANVTLVKTLNSYSVLDIIHTVQSSVSATVVTCFANDSITGERTPEYVRYLSSTASVGSTGMNYRSNIQDNGTETWLLWCKPDKSATITHNITMDLLDQRDSANNTIQGFQNSTSLTGLTGNENLLITGDLTIGEGDAVQLLVTVISQSTSGSQIGDSSPVFYINGTGLSLAECGANMQRSHLSNSDIGTSKDYLDCLGVIVGTKYVFGVYVNVSSGETLDILNVSITGHESTELDVTTGNVPPIPNTILTPAVNESVSKIYNITWAAFDDINDDAVTYTVSIFNSDETKNVTIATSISDTNVTFDMSSLSSKSFYINVEGCDDQTPSLCANRSMDGNFTVDMPPNVTMISPTSNQVINASSFGFIVEVFDDVKVVNVSIYLNGTLNKSSYTGINNVNYTITISFGVNASYSVIGASCDNVTQCSNTSSIVFNLTVPAVTLGYYNCTQLNYSGIEKNWINYTNITFEYFGNITNNDCNISFELTDDDGTTFKDVTINASIESWQVYTKNITSISNFDISGVNNSKICLSYTSGSTVCEVHIDNLKLVHENRVSVDYAAGCNATHYVRLSNTSNVKTKLCEVPALTTQGVWLWANFNFPMNLGYQPGFIFTGSET